MKERSEKNRQISSVSISKETWKVLDFVAATKLLLIPQTKYLIILQVEAIIIDHVYFFSANSDNSSS